MLYSTHALHTCEVRNSTVEQSLCCFPSSVSALIAADYLEDGTTHLDTGLVARAVQKSRFSLDLVQCTLHLQTYLLNLAALLPPLLPPGKREHTPGLPVNPHTWIEEKPPKRISANKCWMCRHWFQYQCWLTNYNKGTAHLDPGGNIGTWSGHWQWTCPKVPFAQDVRNLGLNYSTIYSEP